jgi:hypothetical protein
VSGHEFIEKIVQLPFRVPPLVLADESGAFLKELIPQWEELAARLPQAFVDSVVDVADIGLRANPRQIKRLINSYLLLRRIVEQRHLAVDDQLMTAMIGLQLRWPDHYYDLLASVLADDVEPFQPLLDSEDKSLARYAGRFFAGAPEARELRQLLQLTTVVAAEHSSATTDGDDRPVREIQETMRAGLEESLAAMGYARHPQSSRAWNHPGHSESRVLLRKTVVRLEQRNHRDYGAPWRLVRSFDYRDSADAVEAIQTLLSSG